MLVGALFLTLAVAVAATMYIILPLWENRGSDELVPRKEVLQSEYRRSTLMADRDRLLSALLELDADYELNKIPAGEYAPLREKLVHEAALTLRNLDEINLSGRRPSAIGTDANPDDQTDLEELIELRKREQSEKRAVQEETPNLPDQTTLPDQNSLPDQIALSDQITAYQAYCTHCGNPLMAGDRYCPACGSKIPS